MPDDDGRRAAVGGIHLEMPCAIAAASGHFVGAAFAIRRCTARRMLLDPLGKVSRDARAGRVVKRLEPVVNLFRLGFAQAQLGDAG